MTAVKVESIKTERGVLHVGDSVRLSWQPAGIIKKTIKVDAIWYNKRNEEVLLAFTPEGITNEGRCYSWGGKILSKESILKIIPKKIENWRKVIENDCP